MNYIRRELREGLIDGWVSGARIGLVVGMAGGLVGGIYGGYELGNALGDYIHFTNTVDRFGLDGLAIAAIVVPSVGLGCVVGAVGGGIVGGVSNASVRVTKEISRILFPPKK